MKEILRFKCAPNAYYAIMMVSEAAARNCLVDSSYSSSASPEVSGSRRQRSHGAVEKDMGVAKEIGLCGPNTGDPKVGVRAYSPIPDRPTFQEGRSYYLISELGGFGHEIVFCGPGTGFPLGNSCPSIIIQAK